VLFTQKNCTYFVVFLFSYTMMITMMVSHNLLVSQILLIILFKSILMTISESELILVDEGYAIVCFQGYFALFCY
jgi:hypothetical protein